MCMSTACPPSTTTPATGPWTSCSPSAAELEQEIYHQVADLLNLQVDLLFFDTTSTYFEVEEADIPAARDWRGEPTEPSPDGEQKMAGFRTWGKSKDARDDLPQIVIGMAVTRERIPVRAWCWPGNTSDSALIRQVKDDMRDWSLGRVVWVSDRGFSSAENRRYLQRGAGHYIIGGEAAQRLTRGQGRAVPPRSVPERGRRHAGQGSAHRRRRPVRVVLQSRRSGPRPDHARAHSRQAHRADRRRRQAGTAQTGGAARTHLHHARLDGSCASLPVGCCGWTRPRSRPRPTSTASTCCAAATRR